MNSKERVLAAVNHRETDRVPITFDAEKEVYQALYDHLGLKTREELFDRLNVDTWMLLPGNFIYPASENEAPRGKPRGIFAEPCEAEDTIFTLPSSQSEAKDGPPCGKPQYSPAKKGEKSEKTTIWGYRTKVTRYEGGTYDEVCFNPLAGKDEIADIKAHPWPAPGILDFSHFPREAEQHADRAIIGVFTWGAYFIASFVRGLENLLIDFAVRKDYAECLIRTIAEISAASLRAMLEKYGKGIDIIYMADDYCSQQGPLFSPATFKEFVLPYLKEFVALTHKHGKKFLLHCCGAVRPLLPLIIEAGVDMLEPIQISATGMDPAALKKEFGKDLCFYGGVDLQNTLCRCTPQQVANEVRRLIDTLGRDGGYILGPGHTYIQVDAPLENILTMYETAHTYRR